MHPSATNRGVVRVHTAFTHWRRRRCRYVLPVDKQGPWESRRVWRHTTAELSKRPIVDWAMVRPAQQRPWPSGAPLTHAAPPLATLQVDREKAQLEEEQRVLRCHAKERSPEFEAWATKRFHARPVQDPISGAPPQRGGASGGGCDSATLRGGRLHSQHWTPPTHTPAAAGKTVEHFSFDETPEGGEVDLIALSRGLPDIRGGLAGSGADPAVVALQRTITLSPRRLADLAALDATAAAAAEAK